VASYYNDQGYELVHRARSAGEATPWKETRRQFEIATGIDTELGHAWNNLGVALTRLAEAAVERQTSPSQRIENQAEVAYSHLPSRP
jgi:hypothetical protein